MRSVNLIQKLMFCLFLSFFPMKSMANSCYYYFLNPLFTSEPHDYISTLIERNQPTIDLIISAQKKLHDGFFEKDMMLYLAIISETPFKKLFTKKNYTSLIGEIQNGNWNPSSLSTLLFEYLVIEFSQEIYTAYTNTKKKTSDGVEVVSESQIFFKQLLNKYLMVSYSLIDADLMSIYSSPERESKIKYIYFILQSDMRFSLLSSEEKRKFADYLISQYIRGIKSFEAARIYFEKRIQDLKSKF